MSKNLGQVLRSGQVLGLFAIAAAGMLAGTHALTADRILQSERQRLLRQLQEVLPRGAYDNDVAADRIEFTSAQLDATQPVTVYRARRGGQPVAAVMTVTAPDGYSGAIQMLVGVGHDGHLTGVRVTGHKETPGLGDKIDSQRTDWILRFDGKSLADPAASGWAVKKDGGAFDQFAGATITPRAVVKAVHRSLQYFEQNRETMFSSAAEGGDS
ncbi:MAG: electron transport complex subunit RsxG [Sinimarinibacterium sp.]|jgi:electron transport complex protein RnfG